MHEVPKEVFEFLGKWLSAQPTQSTWNISSKIVEAIQVGGIPCAKAMLRQTTASESPEVKKLAGLLIQMLDGVKV